MLIKKRMIPFNGKGQPIAGEVEREFIFFTVEYNHFRDVSYSTANEVLDKEEIRECECVLCLPESYTDDGEETPLILTFHGAGSKVCMDEKRVGGITNTTKCIDAGYAALDVCGSEPHGITMGCPEHLFAIYKAYRYVTKHYNLSKNVLVSGSSMGGGVAVNFANMFPTITMALGLLYPSLTLEGKQVGDQWCPGPFAKTEAKNGGVSGHDRVVDVFRFPSDEWCENNTVGVNAYKTRSFINCDGERVVIPPCPIKVWQGSADQTLNPAMAEEFVRSVRRSGSYAEYHLLDGVKHNTNDVMREELRLWFNRFI